MRQLILILLILSSHLLMAQRPFVRDVWLNENRTSVKVNSLLMDSKGYMLVGTDQGLYRYNGSTFRLLKGAGNNNPVTSLSMQNGRVWVGYKSGIFGALNNDSVEVYRLKGYKPSSAIHEIVGRSDQSIWLATEDGVVQIKDGVVKQYNTANGLSDNFIYKLTFLTDTKILAGTDQGLNIIDLSSGKIKVSVFSSGAGLQDNIARVVKSSGSPNRYWIGAQQGGLSFFNPETNKCNLLHVAGGWKWGQVNDILVLSPSRAYVATDDGYLLELSLAAADSAMVKAYAFQGKHINTLLLDKSGNIWCSTDNGISMITAEFLSYITLPKPYYLSEVTAMACDRNNRLWFALRNSVCYMDPAEETAVVHTIFNAKEPVSALYCDPQNRLWLGTSGDGLWVKDASVNTFRKIAEPSLAHENILSLTVSAGQLWLSGLNGVKQFDLDDAGIRLVKTHNKASGIGSDYIYQLFTDSKDHIWMATDGAGVCMYQKKGYYHWNTFDSATNAVAYTITEDATGGIWAGTLYKNLFRFKSGQWTNVRKNEVQDIDVNLSTVNANGTGQVVAVYQRCIDLWYPESKFFRHFNSRHNMGIDSTSRILNCSARDSTGNVFIPFEQGMLIFKNQLRKYDIRPDINIVKISNNLKEVPVKDNEYAPDENYMSFYFEGISFTNPERLNYRFRLEGYSNNWVYTNELSATFPKLPPGTYTFRVQVSLNGSFDHASETDYSFTIAAPIWQRLWFIILVVILLASITYFIIRYRDRKLQRLALLEQEKVLFDYEHLKSQVNPHFLFNSLNTLTGLIEDDQKNAMTYTERLSDLYRNMLKYHNKDLISLGEEWDILSAYLYIQQSRFGKALQIKGDIPDELKKTKKIPPMALQLLVENAIKHNVVSISAPLIIEVIVDEKQITVSNEINPKIKQDVESGIGLANISNRYAMLTRRKVYYGKEGKNWVVKLPLV
jgi:ligand-binding sensor domain-containing protein